MLAGQPTNMTVAEYCAAIERNEIVVNTTYQRSDKVWPDSARSFLIESIMLGFPIAKIYLHSITDLKTRKTIKEIIDGQQRSRTIFDFFFDKFPLSNSLETAEIRGSVYSDLPEEWQARFISYSISIDLFVGAPVEEVRQIFRRMNSYTVPLNPEELRHAEYQGPFKWFVYKLAQKYSQRLEDLGIFNERALVRMQDLKLFTEIAHAIDVGITTTSKSTLNSIYKKYDKTFPEQEKFDRLICFAFDRISAMQFLKSSNIAKPYMIYSLAIALINGAEPIAGFVKIRLARRGQGVERRLMELSAALDTDEAEISQSPYKDFIEASAERTNVRDQRSTRVEWLMRAVSAEAE